MFLLLLGKICPNAFCLSNCVCSHADINTHLLSWQANRLLMFLCKHHSAPEGHGINALSANSQHSSRQQHLLWPHVHPYLCACSLHIARFLLLCCLSSFHCDTHTYCISSNTNTLAFSCTLCLIPRPLCLSSDFPVVHCRVADQYIITGFEAHIYYRSNAITTVISLLPLVWPPPSAFSLQVFMEWLCCGGEAQWLPGHCLPPLPWGWGAIAGCWAICALHGGAWWLWNLQAPVIWPNALGVWSSICTSCPWEVLRKVPTFYSIYSGEGISPRRKLLLYL